MTEKYYTPGVCNINELEVANRKKSFYLGIFTGVPVLIVLLALMAPTIYGLLMFMPVWIGAIGYLQAKNKFCVGYAASGLHSKSAEFADTELIKNKANRKLDKARAHKMNIQAFIMGIIGAAVSCGLLALV